MTRAGLTSLPTGGLRRHGGMQHQPILGGQFTHPRAMVVLVSYTRRRHPQFSIKRRPYRPPFSILKSRFAGVFLYPGVCGRHPQCRTKSGHAGADRKDFIRKSCTLAVTPAIRRVWKRNSTTLKSSIFFFLAVTPAIRRVWKPI